MNRTATGGGGSVLRNPIVRTLSSIRLGIALLVLVLLYSTVLSALARVRGVLELTEMEAFAHPLFALLIVAFAVVLSVTTWTRIRWNVVNLGVLTVHAGLLVMCGGALWYFGGKIEGDLILFSPRVELVSTARGESRVVQQFPARQGEVFATEMPAMGGALHVDVVATRGSEAAPVETARVRATLGDGAATEHELTPGRVAELSPSLGLRLVIDDPVNTFYDRDLAALHVRKLDEELARARVMPLHGLPRYGERFLPGENIVDRRGKPVESKRRWPHLKLLGLEIPTGWFEAWRMPIDVPTPDEVPFTMRVTGYLPYVAGGRTVAMPGGGGRSPAISYSLKLADEQVGDWLFALSPASSRSRQAPVELILVTSQDERERLSQTLVGPHELEVELRDPPLLQRFSISPGQKLAIEGTPYELEIADLQANWPLMTPGFEDAFSPVARVNVRRGELTFNRTVVQRFPQLSQDIDAQGVRRTDALVDPNLTLRYRRGGEIRVLCGPQDDLSLVLFDAGGTATTYAITPGVPVELALAGSSATFTVEQYLASAIAVSQPVVEPVERRRPGVERSFSFLRVEFLGRGAWDGWSTTRWLQHSDYPHAHASPLVVRRSESDDPWEIVYSRFPHDLGHTLIADRLETRFFPGGQSPRSWKSEFHVADGGGGSMPASLETNSTYGLGAWTLFQSGAAQDHWSFTSLGVGNRNGIWPMLLGSIMITIGSLYAFYVKPVLKRRRAAASASAARASSAVSAATVPAGVGESS